MTRTESLLLHVRTHISGETYASLERAGYSRWEIDKQVGYGHLRVQGDRVVYVHADPTDEEAR